jgi:DNA-binding NtrC family response regulator
MITDSTVVDINHLPESITAASPLQRPVSLDVVSLDDIQRIHARRMLEYFCGDKIRTAELLGVSRATLYRLLSNNSGGGLDQPMAQSSDAI